MSDGVLVVEDWRWAIRRALLGCRHDAWFTLKTLHFKLGKRLQAAGYSDNALHVLGQESAAVIQASDDIAS